MLHSLEMPSSKRSSMDGKKPNGVLPNGFGSKRPLSNGVSSEQVEDLTGSQTTGTSTSIMMSSKSPLKEQQLQMEQQQQQKQKQHQQQQQRQQQQQEETPPANTAYRDEGYFAETAKVEQRMLSMSTHVKLNEANGDYYQPSNQQQAQANVVQSSSTTSTTTTTTTTTVAANIISSTLSSSPTSFNYLSPESAEKSSERPSDTLSRTLTQPHRTSSPPAFSSPSSGSVLTPSSHANRLQHRHTLEVPRVSTSRASREATQSAGSDEAGAAASGRLSPAPSTPTRRRASMSLVRRVTRSVYSDGPFDEFQLPSSQDLDAARWAEMIRQKRASKRRRKDDDDDDRVVMGTKVDQNHVNYVTAYNMLTGIRFTVSRTNAKLDRELTDADFEARHKFSFDVTGNELTPSARYDFKFKDYAPWVFRHLRSIFRLDPADYLMSLTFKYILSELGSPGKSGSFFYFSRDYKYIIKTIHHSEHKLLRKILKEYYNHVKDNPNTLLSQFYGLHRVKISYGRKIHFVVMNNLFPPHRDIHHTFDLKGSTVGRDFKEDDLEKNPRATLKDMNWLRRNLQLEFGPTKRHMFIQQIKRDVGLLQRLNIMDYSLLVGIHDLSRGNKDNLRDKTLQVFQPGGDAVEDPQVTAASSSNPLMRTPSKLETARKAKELRETLKYEKPIPMGKTGSKMPDEMTDNERKGFYFYTDDGGYRATRRDDTPGEEIYYLGIIDCLTRYGVIKRMEHFIKGIASVESQISAIPPERYADRFVHFISGLTKSRELPEHEEAAGSPSSPLTRRASTTQHNSPAEGPSRLSSLSRSPSTDQVMERAERQVERSQRHGANEANVPDRQLGTIRSPSTDPQEPGSGFTLPVVEEAAENQSTGGHSSRSQDVNTSDSKILDSEEITAEESPPPTPPKDDDGLTVSSLPSKFSASVKRDAPPTPPKDEKLTEKGNGIPPPNPAAVGGKP